MIQIRHLNFLFLCFCPIVSGAQITSNDCSKAKILCNTQTVVLSSLDGPGYDTAEINFTACMQSSYPESNSAWFKWTIETGGILAFTILPLEEQDDIDFVLYRLNDGIEQCTNREELRCLAYGPVLGESKPSGLACSGPTGLKSGAPDFSPGAGCPDGSENFLSPVSTSSGESFLLFVNNYRSNDGFSLAFSGTCTFKEMPVYCNTSQAPTSFSTRSEVTVTPNPVSNDISITISAPNPSTSRIDVVDIHGRIRKTDSFALISGEQIITLDVSGLEPGVYFLKVSLEDQTHSFRFYKH